MPDAYPRSPRSDFINWANAHAPLWKGEFASIGVTSALCLSYQNAVDAATAAWNAQVTAQDAAKAATEKATQAFRTLETATSDMVRRIKAYAENQNDPNVYVLAQIPAPQAAGTVPPPAQPTDITVGLTSDGGVVLKWKASNPPGGQGTSYIIRRKLPGQSGFAFVGVSGKKTFTDTTLTAGPDWVQYTVQGQRADSAGPASEVFTVNFGHTGSGQMTVSAAPRLAA